VQSIVVGKQKQKKKKLGELAFYWRGKKIYESKTNVPKRVKATRRHVVVTDTN